MSKTALSPVPGPAFRTAGATVRGLTQVCTWLCAAGIIAMMLHVCADIILREVFDIVIVGTIEVVSYYYMVAAICLAFPAMQLAGAQVVVEVFVQKMSAERLRPLKIAANVLGIAYVGFLAVAAAAGAWSATESGEMQLVGDTDLATWPSRWINTLGLGVMGLVLVWQVWAQLIRQPEDVAPPDDIDIGEPI